jgi:hypothetical protein
MRIGIPSKNADGPSLRQHHPPTPTFHAQMSNPKRGSASLGFGDAAERGLNGAWAPSLGSPATKSTKNQKITNR